MNPRDAEASFADALAQAGVDVSSSAPSSGFEVMLRFYQDQRADGVEMAADGDMLLFEWGTYDWGQGENFELGLTRQLIVSDVDDDDEAIWQLHLTYRFPPSDELRALGGGDRWCKSPEDLHAFRNFVTTSAPFERAAGYVARSTEVWFENAG